MEDRDPHRLEQPDYIKALLAAAVHACNLGITLLDAQTRFESVNGALARETQASVDQHIGKTSREIVGDLATQIEPTYEKVLRTRKPASVWLVGQVRDTLETGYWLDYCFPILDKSQRVQQLGLFVVNVTLEKTSTEIFTSLATNSEFLSAQAPGLIERFDESVRVYHSSLRKSLKELACPSTETARKVDGFRLSIERLDNDIGLMRELIYAVLDRLPIPKC
jgi:PAS domain-containing protein